MKKTRNILFLSAILIAGIVTLASTPDASARRWGVDGVTPAADGLIDGSSNPSWPLEGSGGITDGATEALNGATGLNGCSGNCTTTTSTTTMTNATNTGYNPATGQYEPLRGVNATYSGQVDVVIVTRTNSDGTTTTTTSYWKPDCHNFLGNEEETVELKEGERPPGTVGGGGGCGTCSTPAQPSPEPRPADAAHPGTSKPLSSTGYASAVATNRSTTVNYGGSSLPGTEDDNDTLITLTQEQINFITSDTDGYIWAKPRDEVAFETYAKAAYLDGYNVGSHAQVTTDLTGYEQRSVNNGDPVSLNPSRRVVAADSGKIFTGTAAASPTFARLVVTPIMGSYVMGYSAVPGTCYYSVPCSCCDTDAEGNITCTTCSCPAQCGYTAGWAPVYGSYIAGWSETPESSGSVSKIARILVPYNYDIELPKITACDAAGTDCWPNYGTTYPGEDHEFQHSVVTKPVYHPGLDQTIATNTRPSTYEIVSFVLSADSGKPGTGPTASWNTRYSDNAYTAGYPASGASCDHYTRNTSLANGVQSGERGCVVVQREQDIYFNTNNGNPNTVSLGGKIDNPDTSSYDVAGNALKSLNPSIVIDDLPAGSKICVAISVWPNDYTGLDRDFTGSTWLHGEPHCLTIAKKPTAQFWGAGVYSTGDITTSQSVKYVPDADGFTASGSHNGLSSNDTARRAFGSWSEYEAVSNSTIRGFATGAALGYNPLGATTSGNFATRPGGFPTGYIASNTFTRDRLCDYSSQTFSNGVSNGVNTECRDSYAMGKANVSISNNAGVTVQRLVSRYSAGTPCNGNTDADITIGGSNCRDTSADDRVEYYSSGATGNVTLRTNGSPITAGSTITVTVPGKLTIADNIIYQDTSYANIADLPQVLIFADSIDILPNVSRIDAWLIVGQIGTGGEDSGILNTCQGFVVGTTGVGACDANSLEITGPVFAEKLALNRTAGAGAGTDASIQPAERFNLRADSYLWSYAQAQRYSQAVVTYTRELAPRY